MIRRTMKLRGLLLLCALLPGPRSLAQSASPTDLYEQGRAAQLSESYYSAIELYKTALEANPSYLQPMIGLAETYFAMGEYEEALRYELQAEPLDRFNLDLRNLEGRTRIGLGEFASARAIFERVLDREPNSMEAKFGLAELDIATGEPRTGAMRFEEALRSAPENLHALLALVIVRDSLGEFRSADRYARIALDAHPDNPQVRDVVARHYLLEGDYARAQREVETALALKQGDLDSTLLLSDIFLRTRQYANVVPLIEPILAANSDAYLLWYALGLAQAKLGAVQDSIESLARGLTIRPDDEISRIAMEDEIIENLGMKDPLRARYARYHFQRGRDFAARYFYDRALIEYRRGLQIDPDNKAGRLLFADVFKTEGYAAKYLSELSVLRDLKLADQDVNDEIDILTNLLADSVSNSWGVSQFTLDRSAYAIRLFYSTKGAMIHYLGQEPLAEYLRALLASNENIVVKSPPQEADSFAAAFRVARTSGSDYFMILDATESERYFSVDCDLYASATGSRLRSFSVYRTGVDRVTDALARVADSVHSALPLEGHILNRRFDQGIVDLGALDGVKPRDSLVIVKNGSLSLAKDRLGFDYPKDAVIGRFVVSRTDALVSQGAIVKNQFFDLVSPGDSVIYQPPKSEEPTMESAPASDLYQTILKIPDN